MSTAATADSARSGPKWLQGAFRPFFLGASVWALVAMGIWLGVLGGRFTPPIAVDPFTWHVHAFLFGYLSAVVIGFVLTAVPNWTRTAPFHGWPLAVLFALWVLGRLAFLTSAWWPPALVTVVDLAGPVLALVLAAQRIIAAGNRRNLVVVVAIGTFLAGDLVFHLQAFAGDYAPHEIGFRVGLAAAVALIALIGGRIVPSFTNNWLKARSPERALPVTDGRIDVLALAALVVALVNYVAWPQAAMSAWMLLLAGVLHAIRLSRWGGLRTLQEPLVWVLHAGYAFIPLGALALGAALLWADAHAVAGALHLWTAGAIGVMTLAVMSRATLGHSGHPLSASRLTTLVYLMAMTAALARAAVPLVPDLTSLLHMLSGLAWMLAYAGFVFVHGRMLLGTQTGSAP